VVGGVIGGVADAIIGGGGGSAVGNFLGDLF